MADSFHKKENNKKKVLKKKIKDQKKESRKISNNKGKGFESMIAYADENGQLGPTPPVPANPQPKSRNAAPSQPLTGNDQRPQDKFLKKYPDRQ